MTRRMWWRSTVCAAVFVGSLAAGSASAGAHTRVFVRIGPPAPVVEVRAVAPGPRYVWVPGYYRWGGAAYVWVPGAWMLPPRPRAVWVAPHWTHERRGWFFVAGHWR